MEHDNCPCMETCPLNHALSLIGGKWKMQILCSLYNNGPTRYNQLKKTLDGVSNTVLANALRELEEEVGVTCGKLTYLGCLYSSPGFSTEVLHMYLAQELTQGACHPDDDEFLDAERVPFSQLVDQVMSGEIMDAKTVALVLKVKQLLGL